VTVLELARLIMAEFGPAAAQLEPLVPGQFRLGDTRHTVSDVSRLEALGWQPTIPVEQNVREYVAWMREQQTTDEFLHEADRIMREQKVVQNVVSG
jgi:dTDP-L-rhamnose 4-epimerase